MPIKSNDKFEIIELLKISSQEFMDKHHHYWNIFFRFIYAIIIITALFILGWYNIPQHIQNNGSLALILTIIILTFVGITACIMLTKEHITLSGIIKRYDLLLASLGHQRLYPPDDLNIMRWEIFFAKHFVSLASFMVLSLIILTVLADILIVSVYFGFYCK